MRLSEGDRKQNVALLHTVVGRRSAPLSHTHTHTTAGGLGWLDTVGIAKTQIVFLWRHLVVPERSRRKHTSEPWRFSEDSYLYFHQRHV